MSSHFEVVVLGAGPGGYVAAVRAGQLGLKTAIVELKYWGGVCNNVGCIPTKSLLRNAEIAHIFNHEADVFGISGDVTFDFGAAWKRSRTTADRMAKGVHFLMKKNKVTEIDGWGTFTDDHALSVEGPNGTETVTFDNVIIAAGDRIVPLEEPEVSAELAKAYKKLGVTVLAGTKVEAIDDSGEKVKVTVSPTKGGETRTLEADKVLQAIGFTPRTEGYGLDNTGVKLSDRGAIEIDDYMRTNVPHIYSIGDCTGKLLLAHTAEAQGVVAAETIAGAETMRVNYDMIPRATYCQPQIGSFGYSEQQAKDKGYDVKTAKFPFSANGKAHGLGEATGFVKLVADAKYGEILGLHMIGPDVTELLPELTLAQLWDLTAEEVARNVHAHPTLSEALKEVAHGISGHMINL
jgi:dihydrolipoamide dehydrogenase